MAANPIREFDNAEELGCISMKFFFYLLGSISLATAGAATRSEYLNTLPLRFEENRGRDVHHGTRYVARAQNFSLALAPEGY
jgi:hypothetical protein